MTWLERILVTPCEQCGAKPTKPCERYETRHQETYRLAVVCASRIAAAEGVKPKQNTGKRHRFGRVVQRLGPFGRTVLGCACETVMTVRGSRYVYSHDDGKTWTPGPDACPGRRP